MSDKISEISKKYGFEITHIQKVEEIDAVLYQMKYKKNGAQLVWVKRNDENKTFAIAFQTIPWNDTGVFHILEHTVLCGSEKYPMKKPFVELIKSSMQTFLNAFTYPDKTVFPLSTRNDKDFLNLMDVYLDAVLHPLSIKRKEMFLQEGWHYEMDSADEQPKYNGVVYNEMKGASASADNVLMAEMNRCLFPDNSYRFEYGGNPSHIPDLTYEEYVEAHNQFYHPSNARVFLEGNINLEQVLLKLHNFFKEYSYREQKNILKKQEEVCGGESIIYYNIAGHENEQQKAILSESFVYGLYDEPEKSMACSILAEMLCSTAEDPLKKVILERGLAENVELGKTDGVLQPYMSLIIRNTSEEKKEEIWELIYDTLKNVVREGLDKKRIKSIINRMEFNFREQDYGKMPQGIAHALHALDSWLYGGNPAQNLQFDKIFESLREKVEQGYFENLIREVFLENKHHARICMLPSKTLAKEQTQMERKRLSDLKLSWSIKEEHKIIEQAETLKKYQAQKDTKEVLKKLPVLDLSDIPDKIEQVPQEVIPLGKDIILNQRINTNGILYGRIYISLEHQSMEELRMITLMSMLLGYVPTKKYSEAQLNTLKGEKLGRFDVQTTVLYHQEKKKQIPYLTVGFSVLQNKKQEIISLIEEILNHSDFSNRDNLQNKIKQIRVFNEQKAVMSGDKFAEMRAGSAVSAQSVLQEEMYGISMIRWLRALDEEFEKTDIQKKFENLCASLFVRGNIVLSLTGEAERAWAEKLLEVFSEPEEKEEEVIEYQTRKKSDEGMIIPAPICFVASGTNLECYQCSYSGAMKVAAHILTYDYLWEEVRVKGGAYGCKMSVEENGNISFTTYRDPNPLNSLNCFRKAGEALARIIQEESLDKYIISTMNEVDPFVNVRVKGENAAENYLCRFTEQKQLKIRSEILNTTKEDLEAVSEILKRAGKEMTSCIVGPERALEECREHLDKIEVL